MRRSLISRDNSIVANALGILVLVIVVPIALIVKLLMPLEHPINLSAKEVAKYLRDFRDGTGGDWDWDDFTSVLIADPRLDDIRARAARLDLPISDAEAAPLDMLIAEAEALMLESKA